MPCNWKTAALLGILFAGCRGQARENALDGQWAIEMSTTSPVYDSVQGFRHTAGVVVFDPLLRARSTEVPSPFQPPYAHRATVRGHRSALAE